VRFVNTNLLSLMLLAASPAAAETPQAPLAEPHPYLLFLDAEGFRLEPLHLEQGQSVSLAVDRDSAVVDVVQVVGPGQSGNLVQRSSERYTITVRREGDTYLSQVATDSRGTRELPPSRIEDLGTYRIRLSATAADGREAAFVIENGLRAYRDDGPVVDMFRGLIPMGPSDVSITTQTTLREPPRAAVHGETDLVYEGGLLFAPVRIPGGTGGEVIVDFAAGTTVVARSALPDGTRIEPVHGIEHSASGARTVAAQMQGAGGKVRGYLGMATLPELIVGGLVFRDLEVGVLSELPEIGGHSPTGILGINALSRAAVAGITYPREGKAGRLRLAPASRPGIGDGFEIPFHRVANHLFVNGDLNGTPVTFVFDTGARRAHLHPRAAAAAGLELKPDDDPDGTRGLDGRKVPTRRATAAVLRLGESDFESVELVVADLPVFASLGLDQRAGLLGNTFLDRFSEVEIDFGTGMIRCVP